MSETNYLNAKNGIEILFGCGQIQLLAGTYDPSSVGIEAAVGSLYMCSCTSGTIYKKAGTGVYDWIADYNWSSSVESIRDFLSLIDTPTTYSGNEGKVLAVGASASNIEFIDAPGGYPRRFIESGLHINIHDWGQYVIHGTPFEIAGTLELGAGSMLILT